MADYWWNIYMVAESPSLILAHTLFASEGNIQGKIYIEYVLQENISVLWQNVMFNLVLLTISL